MSKKLDIPVWSVLDTETSFLVPEEGWLADYMLYAGGSTDAPLIYHLGSALTALATAAANVTIVVRHHDGRVYELPMFLWSIIVGLSGDRKSRAMGLAKRLLERARASSDSPDVLLPADGSLEAWHDFMADSNNVLLYREELAFLLDQSRRGYSESTKSWLLTLHAGDSHTRVIRPKSGEGHEVNRIVIERPRLSILGGIPPDTFRVKTGRGDWRSGFLARFTFWASQREHYEDFPATNQRTETELAKWLSRVAVLSRGAIVLSHEVAAPIADWIRKEVEANRRVLPDEVYSHLIRYQDLGYRIAALFALSRITRPLLGATQQLQVQKRDVELALNVLNLLRRSTCLLFSAFSTSSEGEDENEVLNLLAHAPEPMTPVEVALKMPSLSIARARRCLEELERAGAIIQCRKLGPGRGRKPTGYRVP